MVLPSTVDVAVLPRNIVDASQRRPAALILSSVDMTVMEKRSAVTPASLAYGVGMASMQEGNIEAGLCWLQSAVKEDPNYVPAHKALMEYYQKVGDRSQAATHRIKAETRTP
ncbi:MAG: hypothetical protein ACRELG_15015 [Gemmataceae bacterium]